MSKLLKKNKKRCEKLGCNFCLHGNQLGDCLVPKYEQNCPYAEMLGKYENFADYCKKHSPKELEKIIRAIREEKEENELPVTKRNKKEQAMYELCSTCQFDYGDFASFKIGKGLRGVVYRGCNRFITTGEHLNGAPYCDKTGAHCPYWIEKTEESKKAAQKDRIFKIYRW